MDTKDVWLDSIKKTLKECYPELEITEKKNKEEFPYVIVRAEKAGVFAGNLIKEDGIKVILKNARRLWYWEGAASISQIAMEGTKKPSGCKFPCEVEEETILGVCEILQTTKIAEKSIKEVPVWKV